MRHTLFTAVISSMLLISCTGGDLLVEAERFDDLGGWTLDEQFRDQVGSAYLLAHGLGRRVKDSTARVTIPTAGTWRVWVRTRKWVEGAGSFQVLADGKALAHVFGRGDSAWGWEDGGEVELGKGPVKIALRDMDGFDGRCAGVVFHRGEFPLAPDAALDVRREPVAERFAYDLVVVGGGVPGCCAAVSALALSALRTERFCFEGFLPPDKKEREFILEDLDCANCAAKMEAGIKKIDGVTDAREAINKTIDLCSYEGGGRVVVKPGKYFCKGPIQLKSDVNLHLEDGSEILFSPDPADYTPMELTVFCFRILAKFHELLIE